MDVEQLRADTPGTAHRAHLNNAGAALMSRRTLRAMTDQLELEAGIGGYEAAAESADLIEGTYEGMARLLGADRAGIALFDNSTHAWGGRLLRRPARPGRPHPSLKDESLTRLRRIKAVWTPTRSTTSTPPSACATT